MQTNEQEDSVCLIIEGVQASRMSAISCCQSPPNNAAKKIISKKDQVETSSRNWTCLFFS